jgi:hypothetical protein
MRPYKLVVDYEALEFFQGLSRSDQYYLHGRLVYLRHSPHNHMDRRQRGKEGRDHFIFVRGKFAIKFWIDEAVKEVRILDIHFVRFAP